MDKLKSVAGRQRWTMRKKLIVFVFIFKYIYESFCYDEIIQIQMKENKLKSFHYDWMLKLTHTHI